jgi:hypothetical protein
MKCDLLLRVLLVVAVVLLASNLIASLVSSLPSYAAKTIQYRVVSFVDKQQEATLNKYGSEGWELVALDPGISGRYFIFKK